MKGVRTITLGVSLLVVAGIGAGDAYASTITIHSGNPTHVNMPTQTKFGPITSGTQGGKVVTKGGGNGSKHPCKNC